MPEITKTDTQSPQETERYILLSLLVLMVLVYFFGLTVPFLGPDEARYAQVGREMLERGDLVTPTLGGFTWFEKPALLYWLEMGSYKLFGISEFAARFGPAMFGLGTAASLWYLGRSADREKEKPGDLGLWLALISGSTIGLMVFSRAASFDIIVTFPITAAMACFFRFDQAGSEDRKEKYLPLVLFYVFVGIAMLAKGLIGIIFPYAIVAMFYVLSRRRPRGALVISLIWGTALAVAVAATWYLPMYLRHGWQFIDEFFVQHHFQRFLSNKYQHPQPFYFFLWVLPLMLLPWLPFLLVPVWRVIKKILVTGNLGTGGKDHPISPSPLFLFSAAWLIVPLVFFSLSGSKLPGYILPALPAAAIMTTLCIREVADPSRKWRFAALLTAGSMLVTAAILLAFVVPGFADADSIKKLIRTASDRGYKGNNVLMLHTLSHNAEFYAAGRLVRYADGRQKRLASPPEVLEEIQSAGGTPVIVLVPLKYLSQLTAFEPLRTETLGDNGDLAVVAVSAR